MNTVWESLAGEFSDLSLHQAIQLAVRLLVAAALGALLGQNRERADKSAGMRTYILVAIGSAAFVAVPLQAGLDLSGVSRVLQGLVAGIGFLGAGCILKSNSEEEVHGLTTAAGIWLTAAVGMAAGMGRVLSALLLGVLGWFTLAIVYRWETQLASGRR